MPYKREAVCNILNVLDMYRYEMNSPKIVYLYLLSILNIYIVACFYLVRRFNSDANLNLIL